MAVILMRLIAVSAITLGFIGIFLPGLPTVPFVILSAWAASKGWPSFETWLLKHEHFGPYIRDWRANKRIPRRAKIYAVAMMLFSTLFLIGASVNNWLLGTVVMIMLGTLIWMWRH